MKNFFCNILDKSDVVVYDEYIGSGYGIPTESMIEATKLYIKKRSNIIRSSLFRQSICQRLIGLINNKKFTKNDNVLFIHTGGAVNLFLLMNGLFNLCYQIKKLSVQII